MKKIGEKLYLSTIAEDAVEMARAYNLGLEIAEFCTGMNFDLPNYNTYLPLMEQKLAGCSRAVFHAPFAELCPCAVEPLVRNATRTRYLQAAALAQAHGMKRMVVHGGFTPHVYFEEWFVEESIQFWRALLPELPEGMCILLENVLEPRPELLCEVVRRVDHAQLRLCLDVGHANVESEVPVQTWISAFAPYLAHVHLHNNYGDHDYHNALGDGSLPMEQVLGQLECQAPQATWTIENLNCKASLLYLETLGYL